MNLEFVGNDRYGVVQDPKAAIILNNFGHEVTGSIFSKVQAFEGEIVGTSGISGC